MSVAAIGRAWVRRPHHFSSDGGDWLRCGTCGGAYFGQQHTDDPSELRRELVAMYERCRVAPPDFLLREIAELSAPGPTEHVAWERAW